MAMCLPYSGLDIEARSHALRAIALALQQPDPSACPSERKSHFAGIAICGSQANAQADSGRGSSSQFDEGMLLHAHLHIQIQSSTFCLLAGSQPFARSRRMSVSPVIHISWILLPMCLGSLCCLKLHLMHSKWCRRNPNGASGRRGETAAARRQSLAGSPYLRDIMRTDVRSILRKLPAVSSRRIRHV